MKPIYRVWHIQNPPREPDHHEVETPKEGALLINKLAEQDLKKKFVDCNAFGLEVCIDGEWEEFYNEEGNDIMVLADSL